MAQATKTIDARGSFCPGPLMELIKATRAAEVGDVLEVLSNDAGSAKDIPEWAKKMGHTVLYVEEADGYWKIAIKKER
ncbi:sulfurtransferase TusA family protein [Hydrogenibacillus sp. N12]|uniref:Sulfurtransferase TusA family protein n=1 Tax=Hydrogenibacillus schlegelii TaxID=1484 RepID=A0A947G9X9_HYDSH|nr:sulfurtransferase TusA family protein [Hydrogenibacillus sp. N12]MBT9282921.1 sulfurtransferase TusA family protein [Hydrogenibacillus schlegelii]QZA32295.1 sulfurtransferase TusA family protein [Hydrogenibacillus sp. N12]